MISVQSGEDTQDSSAYRIGVSLLRAAQEVLRPDQVS